MNQGHNGHDDNSYMHHYYHSEEPSYDYSSNEPDYEHDYENYTPEPTYYSSEEHMYHDSMASVGSEYGADSKAYGGSYDASYDGSQDNSHDGYYGSYEHDGKQHMFEERVGSEEYRESEEHDDMPECLKDCEFLNIDSEDSRDMCEWWKVEGEQSNKESCLNDCSPGVTHYVNQKIGGMCADEPVEEVDPMACVMDCPTHEMDPHSAESSAHGSSKKRKTLA